MIQSANVQSAIAYYRVSTNKQGVSGLGLEAQKQMVEHYAASHGLTIIQSFTEVKSGSRPTRREIAAALEACRTHNARLLFAKLDRFARDVGFTDALLKSATQFTIVDSPGASKPFIQMMAVFAEWERDEGIRRTKAGLAIARQRGAKFGNPVAHGQAVARAVALWPRIEEAQEIGVRTIAQLAAYLGLHPTQVRRTIGYLASLKDEREDDN